MFRLSLTVDVFRVVSNMQINQNKSAKNKDGKGYQFQMQLAGTWKKWRYFCRSITGRDIGYEQEPVIKVVMLS